MIHSGMCKLNFQFGLSSRLDSVPVQYLRARVIRSRGNKKILALKGLILRARKQKIMHGHLG